MDDYGQVLLQGQVHLEPERLFLLLPVCFVPVEVYTYFPNSNILIML